MATDSNVTRRRFPWLALILAGAAFALLLGLGTWQVQRLQWKEAQLATINERIHAPPLPLPDIEAKFAAGRDVDYWPVSATGTFLHASERHFLATHDGESGFFVYTPLQLADGRVVWVNRGFVPYDLKEPARRSAGQVTGAVTVTGLARNPLAEKPSAMVPDNDPAKNIFFWKDISAMSATAGLPADTGVLPFFIDTDDTPNAGGLPVGGVTIIDLPNNHLQYAVTWYGLALALLAVVVISLRSRRKTGR